MKTLVVITFSLFTVSGFLSQSLGKLKVKPGKWLAELKISPSTSLPFQLEINAQKDLTVINGEEHIILQLTATKKDTFIYQFPAFDSYIYVVKKGRKKLNGYWLNNNKKDYTIPLTAKHGYQQRFVEAGMYSKTSALAQVNGKWETTFNPDTKEVYKAVGVFDQQQNVVNGTFLTESGDYRFLEGNVSADSLYLSCFDGSHAFLFKAVIKGNSVLEKGKFYSGKHWVGEWKAERNEIFELRNPDSLTFVKEGEQVKFTLKDLNDVDFTYPNALTKNKVVIIQLMGTWCPNCLDESRYFKELYDKYHTQGLEIISIGYEVGKQSSDYAAKITRFKNQLNLDFTFLVGGSANKGIALQNFPMLNDVSSFPTTLFIGKDGEVKRIHTGFNGPGTGVYYEEFKSSTEALLEELLSQ